MGGESRPRRKSTRGQERGVSRTKSSESRTRGESRTRERGVSRTKSSESRTRGGESRTRGVSRTKSSESRSKTRGESRSRKRSESRSHRRSVSRSKSSSSGGGESRLRGGVSRSKSADNMMTMSQATEPAPIRRGGKRPNHKQQRPAEDDVATAVPVIAA